MKSWLFDLAVALGFTTVFCDSLVPFSSWVAFHWSGSVCNLFLAGLVDFLSLWLLLAVLLHHLRLYPRLQYCIWAAMVAFAPALLLEKRLISEIYYVSSAVHSSVDLACLLLWLAAVTLFYRRLSAHAERLMLVYAFLSFSGLVLLGHALWFGWKARHLNPPFPDKMVAATARQGSARPRIVWIVMDELPYRLVFDHRPPGLRLPAFDALVRTSTVFTDAHPPASMTELAMPSYLVGTRIVALTQHLDGGLLLHDAQSTRSFDQHQTVFQDARDAGLSAGVAGWSLPYCRLLPEVLDRCFWSSNQPLTNGMSPGNSLAANMAAPFLFAAPHLLPSVVGRWLHLPSNRHRRVDVHIAEYRQLRAAAEALLRAPTPDLVLIHLPVPHYPDIYDRSTGAVRFVPANSFLDNLALADRCLSELRSVLEQTQQWDTTTVLVMGDHGWRGEAPEGIADSAARSDPRQAYVIKLAGQRTPQALKAPYDSTRTRSLLRVIMHQELRTPEQLRDWTGVSALAPARP